MDYYTLRGPGLDEKGYGYYTPRKIHRGSRGLDEKGYEYYTLRGPGLDEKGYEYYTLVGRV